MDTSNSIKKQRPYIGITGFTDMGQLQFTLDKMSLPESHDVMAGVLINWKVLEGKANAKRRYPTIGAAHAIFAYANQMADQGTPVWGAMHYNSPWIEQYPQDHPFTFEAGVLWGTRMPAKGIQFNQVWPNAEHHREIHRYDPNRRIILQIPPQAIALLDHPLEICHRLAQYGESITDVLLDWSAGKGLPIILEEIRPWVKLLREKFPQYNLVVAGGLCAATIPALKPLFQEFPGLSLDMESKVRNKADELEISAAREALQAATELIESC